jgi:formylglycine-generating enzyme required for sulfatase activity
LAFLAVLGCNQPTEDDKKPGETGGDTPEMTAFTLRSVDDHDNPVEYPGTIDTAAKTVTIRVPYAAILTDCTARVEHTGAAIAPNPAEPRDYLPGEPGELEEGDVVRYTLTAASGGTAVYTVTVQQLSGIATLKQFEIAGHPEYALTPPFVPDTAEPREFSLIVDESVTSLTLIAAATDGTNAAVDNASQTIDLSVNKTATAAVTVTSEDNAKTTVYTLRVKRGPQPITYTVGNVPFKMNFVPKGKFSRDGGDVNISIISQDMRFAETEVTSALYDEVMSKYWDPATTAWERETGYSVSTNNTEAKGNMCFYYAIVFCNKLSIRLDKEPVYAVAGIDNNGWKTMKLADIPAASGSAPVLPDAWRDVTMDAGKNGFRLPTEMEFIWACIGADELAPGELIKPGITITGNLSTPEEWASDILLTWAGKELGYSIQECVNWGQDRKGLLPEGAVSPGKKRVASNKPNVLGLFDMNGNEGEIVWDRSNSSIHRDADPDDTEHRAGRSLWPNGPVTDYAGLSFEAAGTNNRMIKGSSYQQDVKNCLNLYFCDASDPPNNARYGGNGFRIMSKN